MLILVIARYITDPQEKISLHQMQKHNESAEQIRLHWKILSDTLISINKSDEIKLSIYIWHFKGAWWHRYRPNSVPWSGTPDSTPHVQIISTKIVAFF